jgi:hypothetical protein
MGEDEGAKKPQVYPLRYIQGLFRALIFGQRRKIGFRSGRDFFRSLLRFEGFFRLSLIAGLFYLFRRIVDLKHIDLFNALGNISPDEYRAGKLLLTRIGAMLCKLCLLGRVTTLFRVCSRLRARACSRPETPILPTRFYEEPKK